jgi:hypothetical protein
VTTAATTGPTVGTTVTTVETTGPTVGTTVTTVETTGPTVGTTVTTAATTTAGTTVTTATTDPTVAITPTTPVTSATTELVIPTENTVTFVIVITIADEFNVDLQNRESPAFRNTRRRFFLFLIPLYQGIPGFIGIVIISFSPGSIIADINVIFNSTETTPSVQQIQAPIVQARNNGSAPFIIQSLKVTEKGVADDEDGLELWEIILIVCLIVVLLILVLISILVRIICLAFVLQLIVQLDVPLIGEFHMRAEKTPKN